MRDTTLVQREGSERPAWAAVIKADFSWNRIGAERAIRKNKRGAFLGAAARFKFFSDCYLRRRARRPRPPECQNAERSGFRRRDERGGLDDHIVHAVRSTGRNRAARRGGRRSIDKTDTRKAGDGREVHGGGVDRGGSRGVPRRIRRSIRQDGVEALPKFVKPGAAVGRIRAHLNLEAAGTGARAGLIEAEEECRGAGGGDIVFVEVANSPDVGAEGVGGAVAGGAADRGGGGVGRRGGARSGFGVNGPVEVGAVDSNVQPAMTVAWACETDSPAAAMRAAPTRGFLRIMGCYLSALRG